MTTIYGGAQLLAKRELKSDRRQALAEDVRIEADRLYRLVEDLVILVHSERDGIRPVGEPVAVGRLVSAAIEREVARHPGVKIALLGASDAAADGADEVMVTHVIRNLLDNAIRYGGAKGPIEVVVEVTTGEVAVRVNDQGSAPEPHAEPFGLDASRPRRQRRLRGPVPGSACMSRIAWFGRWAAGCGRTAATARAPSSGSRWRGRRGRFRRRRSPSVSRVSVRADRLRLRPLPRLGAFVVSASRFRSSATTWRSSRGSGADGGSTWSSAASSSAPPIEPSMYASRIAGCT